MKRFCVRALPAGEISATAQHLAGCETCHQQFTVMLRSWRCSAPLKFTLAPEFWFRHEHLDYEQLVGLADNALDATEREIIDIHLKVCASCKEDGRSFLAFRESMEQEMGVSVPRAEQQQRGEFPPSRWWQALAWKPIYATAVVVLGIALVIGAAFLVKRRTDNLQAKESQPTQVNISTPSETPPSDNRTPKNGPSMSAPVLPSEPPKAASTPLLTVRNQKTPKDADSANGSLMLNDGRGTISIDRAGRISGLDEIPEDIRREIAAVLIAENVKAPDIVNELSGTPNALRGTTGTKTFKLLSPANAVIIADRPSFEWEHLPGATSYHLLVGDSEGHEVVKSEPLPADQTRWTAPSPLKRGEIYSWAVAATVDGKKVFSPGTSAPEMKFKILSMNSAQKFVELKKARSHLALGVFYAHEGMVAESQREFEILVRENPHSAVLKKLLKQIQSWESP